MFTVNFYDASLAFLKKEAHMNLEQHEGEQTMSKLVYLDGDYFNC